uniref:Uncharacterized protein n=1 Tax=Arundo donax TaxID=35708 RepID=A0A0A8YDC3_ARUDO
MLDPIKILGTQQQASLTGLYHSCH